MNGTRRENPGFYYAGIDFTFSGIKSSNVQNSNVFFLFSSFCSGFLFCSSPFTAYNGTTRRIKDTTNLIAVWIEFKEK